MYPELTANLCVVFRCCFIALIINLELPMTQCVQTSHYNLWNLISSLKLSTTIHSFHPQLFFEFCTVRRHPFKTVNSREL